MQMLGYQNLNRYIALLLVALLVAPLHAQTARLISTTGFDAARLAQIDAAVEQGIKDRRAPGAVVLIGRKGKVAYRQAFGNRALVPSREAMTVDTIFDAASLTKVVATATSIMLLIERGHLNLNDSITKHLPELKGAERERITVEHLLTHTSGYAPDFDLRERWTGTDEALKRLTVEPLRTPAGERFVYSDIGFIALGEIVKRLSGQPLDEFARTNIFQPLKMRDTNFRRFNINQQLASGSTPSSSLTASQPSVSQSTPSSQLTRISDTTPSPVPRPLSPVTRIAPTETQRATTTYLGGTGEGNNIMLRGIVHDPTAQRMEGVAGHAGLFTTADDLHRYCQMILNGGVLDGVRVISPLTIAEMTRPRVINDAGATRGLGWDMKTGFSANRGNLFPDGSFGHTGFTGTSLWLDPASESYVVFLSNRVHPDGKGDVSQLRGRVSTIAASALLDVDAERLARQQSLYDAEVAAGLARRALVKKDEPARPASNVAAAQVLNGIDVLEREGFAQLKGLRVGLVTNHTGTNINGRATIDILQAAPGVKLVNLFSPEHGIRGALDEKVSDSKDEKTGLPIYSLYGESRRPKPDQLKDIDAIVYDIQDIGARFYTYISTLGNVMEEAAKLGKPVFVLDRPNPINGVDVEGSIADADKLSFTAYHTIPVRHGLTIGELGTLFNRERKIGCDLRVIKMQGWQRAMWFDQTNQTWVNPSPNMRSLTQATLYPGIGLLETTNLSVGRGTDTPFQIIGAPYLDGRQLAAELNAKNLRGLRFVPVRFTPRSSKFKDETCGGIEFIITNRQEFRPVAAGIEIARTLRRMYPTEWKIDDYNRLLANLETFEMVKRTDSIVDILRSFNKPVEDFKTRRASALLY